MIWYVILGLLAAFGLFCAMWAAFGFFLPGSEKCTLVVLCHPRQEPALLRRLLWLRGLGLLRCGIRISGRGLTACQRRNIRQTVCEIEFFDPEMPGE